MVTNPRPQRQQTGREFLKISPTRISKRRFKNARGTRNIRASLSHKKKEIFETITKKKHRAVMNFHNQFASDVSGSVVRKSIDEASSKVITKFKYFFYMELHFSNRCPDVYGLIYQIGFERS